jgi:hypothetical protein
LRRRQRRRCRRTATTAIARVIRDIAANQALERRRDRGTARHRRRRTTSDRRRDVTVSDPSVVVARITDDDDDDDDDARVRATAITHATSEVWAVAVAVDDVARRTRSRISLARTVDTWTRHLEASRRAPTRGRRRREGLTRALVRACWVRARWRGA